jgi:hypothetical protein
MQCACALLHCHLWSARLYSIFLHYFPKKWLKTKRVFLFSLQNLSETFVVLRRTERDMIKSVYWSYIWLFNRNWVATRWQLFSTHIHTNNTGNVSKQTIHRTQKYIEQHKKDIEQHNNWEECGPCLVFAGFTLAFALEKSTEKPQSG